MSRFSTCHRILTPGENGPIDVQSWAEYYGIVREIRLPKHFRDSARKSLREIVDGIKGVPREVIADTIREGIRDGRRMIRNRALVAQ